MVKIAGAMPLDVEVCEVEFDGSAGLHGDLPGAGGVPRVVLRVVLGHDVPCRTGEVSSATCVQSVRDEY